MCAARRAYHWLVRAALLAAAAVVALNAAGRQGLREAAALPRDPETGIMRGAEPIHIVRGRLGACLLLHGWTSSPADFGDLPKALDAAGWDVYAPLHTGHGTSPTDLDGISAQALVQPARAQYDGLLARYDRVVLIGFSMGGTIAAILAAERPPDRLVLVAPFCGVTQKWYYVLPARWWSALLSPLVSYAPGRPAAAHVNRPEGRDEVVAYAAFPSEASEALFGLREMLAGADLGALRMPLLMLYSTGDETSSPPAMSRLFERLPAGRKRRIVFERSNHYLLHDYDREEAVRAIVGFVCDR
jgi:carboxylesterase